MKTTRITSVALLGLLGLGIRSGVQAAPAPPPPPRAAQTCIDEAHTCLASACPITQAAQMRWVGADAVSSVIALNQRLYAVDTAETALYAIRTDTGVRTWSFQPENAVWLLPPACRLDAAGRTFVYVTVFLQNPHRQVLYCLRDEGQRAVVMWQAVLTWRTQEPITLSGDRILYFGYYGGIRLVCLSAETGEEIFHRDLPQSSRVIDDKPAVNAVLRQVFYRIDGALFSVDFDGNLLWQVAIPTSFFPTQYGVITVDVPEKRLYFRTPQGRLRGYNSQTGALLWEYGVRVLDQVHGLVLGGPLLFVKEDTAPTAALVALDTATGHLVWRQPIPRSQLVGTRLVGTGASRLWVMDVAGGSPGLYGYNRWTGQLLGTLSSSLEAFTTDTDGLYVVHAPTHQVMRLSNP